MEYHLKRAVIEGSFRIAAREGGIHVGLWFFVRWAIIRWMIIFCSPFAKIQTLSELGQVIVNPQLVEYSEA